MAEACPTLGAVMKPRVITCYKLEEVSKWNSKKNMSVCMYICTYARSTWMDRWMGDGWMDRMGGWMECWALSMVGVGILGRAGTCRP